MHASHVNLLTLCQWCTDSSWVKYLMCRTLLSLALNTIFFFSCNEDMCHKKIADKFICTSCVPLNVLPPVLRLLLVCSYPSVFAVPLIAVLSFLQSLCVMFHYSKGIPSAWHELKYFWSWESFRWVCYSLTECILKCIGQTG